MIGTVYRITPPGREPVEGRVQGNGGVLGGDTPRARFAGLQALRLAASGAYPFGGYEPKPGHVRVYPNFTAEGNGAHVDVQIVGALVEIVR